MNKIKAMKKPSVYIMIAKHGVLREREEKLKEGKRGKRGREGEKEEAGGRGKEK